MVRGYMRVSEAITEASGLGLTLILFGVLYFVLVTTTILVLTRMFKDKSAKDSQIQYYGTESLDETGGRF